MVGRHAQRADLGIEGVLLAQVFDPTEPTRSIAEPILAVTLQGSKRIALGNRIYEYGAHDYLVVAVDLPITGQYVEASRTRPYLGFGLTLRPARIAALLLDAADLGTTNAPTPEGISVSSTTPDMLDAVLRLLRLIDRPTDLPILAPLIERELLWLALTGAQGNAVRQIGLADSSLSHIGRAIRHLRANVFGAIQVEELAQVAAMSLSSFHRHFRTVTAMSPIQYQKRIRLQEARLMLLTNPTDIAGVGHAVGYGSASQFSREYRREFGVPPRIDAERLREPAGLSTS